VIAEQLREPSPALRRHRVQIADCIVELVGDDPRTHRLFAADWATAPAGSTDVYLYVFAGAAAVGGERRPGDVAKSQTERAVACVELGRGLFIAPASYGGVRRMCRELVAACTARARARGRPRATAEPLPPKRTVPAACAEFVTRSGASAGILLLGRAGAGKSTHACLLARARPGSALVADAWTIWDARGIATAPESRFLLRPDVVRSLPRLLPAVLLGLLDADALPPALAEQVARFHGPADLAQGIDDGLIAESAVVELRQCLAATATTPVLIRAVDWIEPNRIADSTQVAHCVWLEKGLRGGQVLRTLDDAETIRRLASEVIGIRHSAAAQRTLAAQLRAMATPRGAVLDTTLPASITQFCLRHYLDGLSDLARLAAPADPSSAPIARDMRLREPRPSDGNRETPRFCQGPYPVQLLVLQVEGRPVEALALDDRCFHSSDAVDPFAQIKAVWPGQITDFFTRHGPLRLRELFAEVGGC
jgi:hypothetical protein